MNICKKFIFISALISVILGIANAHAHAQTLIIDQGETYEDLIIGTSYATTTIHSSGTTINTTINSGGTENVYEGGIASSTTINNGGWQNVYYGATTNYTTITAGGVQCSSGTVNNTIINGGWQNVYGVALNTTINGGYQITYEGGAVTSTIINNGEQHVNAGVTAVDTTINGGVQLVFGGGAASSTTINGGYQEIYSGATASSTTINGGQQNVHGAVTATAIDGGTQLIYEGGVASTTTINGGGQFIYYSGTSSSTTINMGGIQWIYEDGTASSTTINNGGVQHIYGDGTATDTTINSGGTQNISSYGYANTVINNGTVNLSFAANLTNYSGNGNLYVYGSNSINGTTGLGTGQLIFANSTPITLNVQNLSANGAVISMNVNLENQTSDKLVINGTYTGDATLNLTNYGSTMNPTTGNGILLVDFTADNTGGGTFSLPNGQWDPGAYVYELFQDNGDPDYYLRSVDLSDTFKTMLNFPSLNAVIAKTGMNSLNKRLGDLSLNKTKTGLWFRSYYKDITVDDLIKTDMSLFGLEAGFDLLLTPDSPTKLYTGIMAGYMQSSSMKTKTSNGSTNDGKGNAPSLGLYITLVNDDNWFVDLTARNFWTKTENTAHTSSNNLLSFDIKRNMLTASFEIGKNITNGTNLKVQPKLEVSYMRAGKDSTPVTNGVGNLYYDSATYLTGKAALMFSYKAEMGRSLIFEPLIELAYNHEFKGEGNVSYSSVTQKTSLKGGSAEIDAGFAMQLADNLYWHTLASYEKGSKLSGWGIHAGIRIGFGNASTRNTSNKRASAKKVSGTKKNNAASVKKYSSKKQWNPLEVDDNKFSRYPNSKYKWDPYNQTQQNKGTKSR